MALEVATNVGNRVNQMGNFKELYVGAGGTVFKCNKEGVFAGGIKYSTAPFRLSYNGILGLGLAAGPSMTMDGSAGTISLKYDNTVTGSIDGYTTEGSEVSYIRIVAASGRYIKLKNSFTEIDGSLVVTNATNNAGIRANSFTARIGSTDYAGIDDSFAVVTNTRMDSGTLQHKKVTMTFKKGLLTNRSDESGWENA